MTSSDRKADLRWTDKNVAAMLVICLAAWTAVCICLAFPKISFASRPPCIPHRVNAARQQVDPNTASKASLVRLPLVGANKAQRIIDYRSTHPYPAFRVPADLQKVRGIGKGITQRVVRHNLMHINNKPPQAN